MTDLKAGKEGRYLKEIKEWLKSFIFALVIATFLINYVVFIATVPTGSMIPTIKINDRVIVWKVFRYFNKETKGLKHGDIVVFKAPQDELNFTEKQLLVKRVIGLGGDVIKIENGVVYRNGEILDEPYVKSKSSFFMNELEIPMGEVFVLGDNRGDSYDSRFWPKQTFSLEDVVGEVIKPIAK